MTATKMPTSDVPLIQDPDVLRAVDRELQPFSGKSLERAQAAVRRVHGSGIMGSFDQIVAAYRGAIQAATKGGRDDG